MGLCTSCHRNTVISTAKLVHDDGRLAEFQSPIRASHILQRHKNNFFICDADDLGLDEFISPIDDEDELQLGHLYLELPIIRLNSPVTPKEITALAVKASLALENTGDGRYRFCLFPMKNVRFSDYFKSDKSEEETEARTPLVHIAGELVRRRQGGGGGGRKKRFTSELCVILEGKEINEIRNH